MDHNATALSEQQVAAARTELADRIGALERKVCATVSDTTDNVRAASAAIRDGVQTAYDTASEKVREALDVRQRIREHPWASLGSSATAGFLAGFIPARGKPSVSASYASEAPAGPSPWRSLMDILKRELVAVGESAIVTASATLRNNVAACMEPQQRMTATETSG